MLILYILTLLKNTTFKKGCTKPCDVNLFPSVLRHFYKSVFSKVVWFCATFIKSNIYRGMQLEKYLVEFFGTFVFLYVIISTGHPLAIGATLAFCVFFGGKISGGNFNPAVTLMMAAAKKLPTAEVVPYIVAQVAGGLMALELFKRM